MIISGDDPASKSAQRFEVFTGTGKRRDWPPKVKASIVAECYSGREGRGGPTLPAPSGWGWRWYRPAVDTGATSPETCPVPVEGTMGGLAEAIDEHGRRARASGGQTVGNAAQQRLDCAGAAIGIGHG